MKCHPRSVGVGVSTANARLVMWKRGGEWSPDEVLTQQLAMNKATWAELQRNGVTEETQLSLDFYEAPDNESAEALTQFLRTRRTTTYGTTTAASPDRPKTPPSVRKFWMSGSHGWFWQDTRRVDASSMAGAPPSLEEVRVREPGSDPAFSAACGKRITLSAPTPRQVGACSLEPGSDPAFLAPPQETY